MTDRAQHRPLNDQLRDWSTQQISALLERRADLVHPQPPTDFAGLAERAQDQHSLRLAIGGTFLPENRLLQVVVCCRPAVPLEEFARALPEGVGLADVERWLSSLEAAALVWRHEGRLHCSKALRNVMPTSTGPPLQMLVEQQTTDYVKSALGLLRTTVEERGLGTPERRWIGPGGRPPRKAELVEALESLLATPEVVKAVIESGPTGVAEIATAIAQRAELIPVEHPMYFSPYTDAGYYRRYPTYWLYERAILLPLDSRTALPSREVCVALRGGRPVDDLGLTAPALVMGSVEVASVDALAADRAVCTLDRMADLLDRWTQSPAKLLKSGGLGSNALKQAAGAIDADATETARLVELAYLAGLVEKTTVTRRENRRYVVDSYVRASAAGSAWVERPVARRWAQLADAWMRAEHWPSAAGRKVADRKSFPVLTTQHAIGAHDLREDVLGLMAALDPGDHTNEVALAASAYWMRPQRWLDQGIELPITLVEWIYGESELLGIIASGTATTFGRALIDGDRAAAERALEAALPETTTSFTLQADLTATVVGALDRQVWVELRQVADIESRGGATTFRFSETSLRRAIDAGLGADAIMAFLEAHATKGVPKSLAYLIGDVDRRYGHLSVGVAGSFVTSQDPAVLADACSHRRTRKLALRSLAPTVAVSHLPPAKVIDALRDAGFLPTGNDDGAAAISVDGPQVAASSTGERHSLGQELPEPFRMRSPARLPFRAVDAGTAARLAEEIAAGDSDLAPVDEVGNVLYLGDSRSRSGRRSSQGRRR